MGINERLKILIDLLGLKLKDFSRQTGIPYTTLQHYLNGRSIPGGENLQKIITKFGINTNWLLTGEGEPFLKKEDIYNKEREIDPRRQAIIQLIIDMPEDKLDDIFKMLEKEKLLLELLEERRKLKDAG